MDPCKPSNGGMPMKIYLSKFLIPISQDPLENGALVVSQNRIRDCGDAGEMKQKYPKGEIVDCGDSVILPGLVNAHCHLELHDAPPYEAEAFSTPIGEPVFIHWLVHLSKYQDSLKPEEKRSAIRKGLKELKREGV